LIFLDFCKAFDKIPHTQLLSKLKYYGITGDLNMDRAMADQQVTLENHVSSKLPGAL